MFDPRIAQLSQNLVNYSTAVKPGDKLLIEAIDVPPELPIECARAARAAGGHPLVLLKSVSINRALMMYGTRESWDLAADVEALQMQNVQCYIGARGIANISEMSDLTAEQQRLYESTVWKRVHIDIRVPKTRWCVLRWPSPSMAQLAQMSTTAFEDLYFDVCTLDYAKMNAAMKPLQARMQAADRVRIKGPQDTDLTFSIKAMPAITCSGSHNIPDGEVFTA
ncbi:MAG: aminopeptidase, partial [Acidobacteriia bacterium]|nr:aminopeptidase [Terriglobia bacterium]